MAKVRNDCCSHDAQASCCAPDQKSMCCGEHGDGCGCAAAGEQSCAEPLREAVRTDEMLELARRNAAEAGLENVEFVKGYLEDLPLPDASVDVVISNCVINLSGDKSRVIAEAARVLRGGVGPPSPT